MTNTKAVQKVYPIEETAQLPVKCRKCKKSPRLCQCAVYSIEVINIPNEYRFGTEGVVTRSGKTVASVLADNVATMPVRGEEVGTWQPRRNARVWRRPQRIDGFLMMKILDHSKIQEVQADIEAGTFFIDNYREREGFYVPDYPRNLLKVLPVFRRPKGRK